VTVEMFHPQDQLLRELRWPGITQASVAITYAFLIEQEGSAADWPKVNAAIQARWKGRTALDRIEKMAWKRLRPPRGVLR